MRRKVTQELSSSPAPGLTPTRAHTAVDSSGCSSVSTALMSARPPAANPRFGIASRGGRPAKILEVEAGVRQRMGRGLECLVISKEKGVLREEIGQFIKSERLLLERK